MNSEDWRPSCSLSALKQRAHMLSEIRHFFASRGVLEVETPLLCATTATDPFLASVEVPVGDKTFFLQTSPEFAMKRLLASGSGPIFQICKAFREGERGIRHNPEFSMLEWYRPGFDEHDLMAEVTDLLRLFLSFDQPEKVSYRELFQHYLRFDPFIITDSDLSNLVSSTVDVEVSGLSRDTLLDLLLTHFIESGLGRERPCFVYHYPSSQASLAEKVWVDGVEVGRRFELYIQGTEIANGYFELVNAEEQKARFLEDIQYRESSGLSACPLDQRLIAALSSGMPATSGVALGLDRLLMKAFGAASIEEVIAFPIEKA